LKKSVVLFEVIVSLVLFSIIALVGSKMISTLAYKNHINTFHVEKNIILETTQLFLRKNNDFTQIEYRDEKLFFGTNLLLENVSKFERTPFSNSVEIVTIDICIEKNTFCQTWKIRI